MDRKFEVCIRITVDTKCNETDEDIIRNLIDGADKDFYPYCYNEESIKHISSTAFRVEDK